MWTEQSLTQCLTAFWTTLVFRERLSRSAFGGHLNGVPMKDLIKCRLAHPFGFCTVIVGAKEVGDGSFIPFARCWICGKDSPKDEPSYSTIREHFESRKVER
jgi:hypothetical protein